MVVGFTTTYAIIAYHHQSCEFESRSWRDVRTKNVLDTTLCDIVCQVGGFLQLLRFPLSIQLTAMI